jgi:hypothetical protein
MRTRSLLCGLTALVAALYAGPAAARDGDPTHPDAPVANAMDTEPTGSANPHGSSAGTRTGTPGVFEPPPDTAEEDASLPAGTIEVTLLDADDHPVPRTQITLGILQNSVAKGESRRRVNGETNESGVARFDKLEAASQLAYRVSVVKDGATFAASPFNLPPGKGIRVRLHVYSVTRDINVALVIFQVVLYAEMKDDRVQIQQAVTVYNFGRTAWVPDDVVLGLPEGFTALNGTQQMSDVGIDPVEKRGARLRGTFSPGRHDVEFRWQVPYGGEKEVSLDVDLPPHVAAMRVMAVASQQMRLVVSGFGEAEPRTDNQGQRILVTERALKRDEPPLKTAHIEIRDLPTAGPDRWIATGLTAFGVLAGLVIAFGAGRPGPKRAREGGKAERTQLLIDLEDLERAHAAGEVGPKTYERARRELIDLLARTLVPPRGDAGRGPARA